MSNISFKVLRGGTHSTFQDEGCFHFQHLGITTTGAIDFKSFNIANAILSNNRLTPCIEFAFQGPLLELLSGKCRFVVTGKVNFHIIINNKITKGLINNTYIINKGDRIDILSTINSNYGYLSVDGGFVLEKEFGSSSIISHSKIGSNNGNILSENQIIFLKKNPQNLTSYLNYTSEKNNNVIRVIRGPQMDHFMLKTIKNFFYSEFIISRKNNRIGIRLEGNIIKAIKSHDIQSEGIIRGSIQVPGNGEPIILMNDHPTIGGYTKIAIVILADQSRLAQFTAGSKIRFKEVTIEEAEEIYFLDKVNLEDIIKNIKTLKSNHNENI